MEGVADWGMRQVLTHIGGIDQCTTEFLRVTDHVHSDEMFYKNCPELKNNSRTLSGTPTFVQLLGSNTEMMAQNAARAVELGAAGIDLNFGCPAKTVNRHDGGAALLKSPKRIYDIVRSVKDSLRDDIPLTAKIRLGFADPNECFENAKAVESAGAAKLTVHCRTKMDAYKPPAFWEWIPRIKEQVQIPLIANGEIWTVQDFKRCQEITNCNEFMVGRGAIQNPYLFFEIKNQDTNHFGISSTEYWQSIRPEIHKFYMLSSQYMGPKFSVARTKQWLKYLAVKNNLAKELFERIKVLHDPVEFEKLIKSP